MHYFSPFQGEMFCLFLEMFFLKNKPPLETTFFPQRDSRQRLIQRKALGSPVDAAWPPAPPAALPAGPRIRDRADGQMKWAVRRVRSKKQPCVWRVAFAPGVLRGRKRGDVGFSHPRAADVAPYTSIQTGILAVTRDSSRVRNDN